MINIQTKRMLLIPLSSEQLGGFLENPDVVAEQFGFPFANNFVDENVRHAIRMKLATLNEFQGDNWLWKTYWLIKINTPEMGVGLVGFKGLPDEHGIVEIGYGIDADFQNLGYMTEAVQALLGWAFRHPECNSVTARRVSNPASVKVLQKCGFQETSRINQFSNWIQFKSKTFPIREIQLFQFQPIGMIFTPHDQAAGTPIQPSAAKETFGTILLHPDLVPGLQDLVEFSHIILLYVFDRVQEFKLNVIPFMDDRERGLFATRAPARPNPIGISVVELLRIEDNVLYIKNVDMLNRTPLLDIKPYVPQFDPVNTNRIGWLGKGISSLETTQDDGRFSDPQK